MAAAASRERQRLFEVEDLVLLGWTLACFRLAEAAGLHEVRSWEEGGVAVVLLATAALGGVLFAAITESDSSLSLDAALLRRVLLWGPLYPLASLVVAVVNLARRARLKAARPAGTPWAAVPEVDDWPGPCAPRALRRAAAVPYALAGDVMVRHFVADAEAGFGVPGGDAFTHVLVPLVSTFGAYLFFVVGPRLATGASPNPLPWLLRFASYFTAFGLGRGFVA